VADDPGVNLLLSRLPKLPGLAPDVWAPRHRAIVALAWAHVPVILLWSLLKGFPVWHAALDALPIVALALLADAKQFSQTARSCVGALALVTCSAIIVHVAGGALAAHFHFFVVLPVIGLYGQWKPFLCAVGYIVVHHGIFALLAPRAVFPGHPDMGMTLKMTSVHAAFVVAEVVALVASWKLAEDQSDLLDQRNQQLDARQGELDATVAQLEESGLRTRMALETVTALTGEVRGGARTVAGSAEEIRETVARNTAAVSQQSAAIESASGAVESVREVAERTAADAAEVATASRESLTLTQAGAEALQEILGSLGRIRDEVGATATGVATLSDRVRAIGEITAAVDDLSEQSKLLALNASIEAARAGEHGRGFAVVAEEVRALAERSRASTAAVGEILKEIDVATRDAVVAAQRGADVVEEGTRQAAETEGVIARLSEAAAGAAQRVGEIADAAGDQRARIEDVAASIRTAADQTAELVGVAAHAEDVAGRLQSLAGDLEALTEQGA
jgi:methyl-accepting chemotaxis protein